MKIFYTKEMKQLRFWYYYTMVFMYLSTILVAFAAVLYDCIKLGFSCGLVWAFWYLHNKFMRKLESCINSQAAILYIDERKNPVNYEK